MPALVECVASGRTVWRSILRVSREACHSWLAVSAGSGGDSGGHDHPTFAITDTSPALGMSELMECEIPGEDKGSS